MLFDWFIELFLYWNFYEDSLKSRFRSILFLTITLEFVFILDALWVVKMDIFIILHGLRYYQKRDVFIVVMQKPKSFKSNTLRFIYKINKKMYGSSWLANCWCIINWSRYFVFCNTSSIFIPLTRM